MIDGTEEKEEEEEEEEEEDNNDFKKQQRLNYCHSYMMLQKQPSQPPFSSSKSLSESALLRLLLVRLPDAPTMGASNLSRGSLAEVP